MIVRARHVPQLVIAIFLCAMAGGALLLEIPLPWVINDALVRLAMNGVLVLSLVPMLNVGIGINFGLPVAIVAGLLGLCLTVNWRLTGSLGFTMALALSTVIAVCLGEVYGRLLNRVRGREEITATFIGFSFIPLTNFFWATAPFTNPAMLWPIGGIGMRPTIGLKSYFAKILNTWMPMEIGPLTIPCGLLLFFGLCCLLVNFFFKTTPGLAILAIGENEGYARLCGIDVDRMRRLAVILSTVIGAVGICVYAQSYGFIELYDAPMMMAFPAASAILIGGSTTGRATVAQVVAGTFLFHTMYVLSGPLANDLLVPEMAEIFRLMMTTGVILFAMLHHGGRHARPSETL
jgi:simple sugar transport system permease protein